MGYRIAVLGATGAVGREMINVLEEYRIPVDELKLQLSSGASPCIILPGDGSDSFLYLILPVRIRSEV